MADEELIMTEENSDMTALYTKKLLNNVDLNKLNSYLTSVVSYSDLKNMLDRTGGSLFSDNIDNFKLNLFYAFNEDIPFSEISSTEENQKNLNEDYIGNGILSPKSKKLYELYNIRTAVGLTRRFSYKNLSNLNDEIEKILYTVSPKTLNIEFKEYGGEVAFFDNGERVHYVKNFNYDIDGNLVSYTKYSYSKVDNPTSEGTYYKQYESYFPEFITKDNYNSSFKYHIKNPDVYNEVNYNDEHDEFHDDWTYYVLQYEEFKGLTKEEYDRRKVSTYLIEKVYTYGNNTYTAVAIDSEFNDTTQYFKQVYYEYYGLTKALYDANKSAPTENKVILYLMQSPKYTKIENVSPENEETMWKLYYIKYFIYEPIKFEENSGEIYYERREDIIQLLGNDDPSKDKYQDTQFTTFIKSITPSKTIEVDGEEKKIIDYGLEFTNINGRLPNMMTSDRIAIYSALLNFSMDQLKTTKNYLNYLKSIYPNEILYNNWDSFRELFVRFLDQVSQRTIHYY